MRRKIKGLGLVLGLLIFSSFGIEGTKMTVDEYINTYKKLAISEMKRVGIPASITLAQGILESGTGNSRLAVEGNNHFGIKCHNTWTGKTIYENDDAPNECFRKYNSAYESYLDHSNFLFGKPRYAELFTFKSDDYKSWAHGLKKAGYATNPNYGPLLIDLIEKYQLYKYDDPNASNNVYVDNSPNPSNNPKPNTNDPKPIPGTTPIKIEIKIEPKQQPVITSSLKKLVFLNNGIKATKAQKNEDAKAIAKKFSMPLTDFLAINDLSTNTALKEGQIMYLQSKKKKTKVLTHQVEANEKMWNIAQKYGIKLELLLNRNQLKNGQEVAEKEIIYLRKKTKNAPKLYVTPQKPSIKPPVVSNNQPPVNNKIDTFKMPISTLQQIKSKDTIKEKPIVSVKIESPKLDTLVGLSSTGMGVKSIIFNDIIPMLPENSRVEVKEDDVFLKIEKNVVGHYVQAGETLYSISKLYGITVDKIMEMNKLEDTNIKIGDIIIVAE